MPRTPDLSLDSQLCFALYSTSLAITQQYKKHLAEMGMTYPQYVIMMILWENDGVSLKHIASRLDIKSGALTPVIKRMESDGFLVRERGIEDDRTLTILLTKKGKSLYKEGIKVKQCISETYSMDQEELTNLIGNLKALKSELSKHRCSDKQDLNGLVRHNTNGNSNGLERSYDANSRKTELYESLRYARSK